MNPMDILEPALVHIQLTEEQIPEIQGAAGPFDSCNMMVDQNIARQHQQQLQVAWDCKKDIQTDSQANSIRVIHNLPGKAEIRRICI